MTLVVGCLPVASALGLEAESDSKNSTNTTTVLTYVESEEKTSIEKFITDEKTDEAWKNGFAQFSDKLKEEGYENPGEAFDTDDMVYVGGEEAEKPAEYVKDGEQESIPLKKYDGKGGEHYLWRYCKAEKTEYVDEAEKTQTEYFWVRTDEKVDLEKWETESAKDVPKKEETQETTEEATQDEVSTVATGALQNVFIGGSNGKDSNDGASVNTPVASFAKAKELLASNGTIWVVGVIKPSDEYTTFELGNEYGNAQLKRWVAGSVEGQEMDTYSGYLIAIASGKNLTLQNIVIDGGGVEQDSALIHVEGKGTSSLTMNANAVLQNNIANKALTTSANAGAIVAGGPRYSAGGTSVININDGATIQKCFGNRAGAISVAAKTKVNITGGSIIENSGDQAGAFYISCYYNMKNQTYAKNQTILNISGGDISGNSGKVAGGVYSNNANVNISGGNMHDNTGTGDGGLTYRFQAYKEDEEEISYSYNSTIAGWMYASAPDDPDLFSNITITGGEIYGNSAIPKNNQGLESVGGAIVLNGIRANLQNNNYGQLAVGTLMLNLHGGSIHDNISGAPSEYKNATGAVVVGGVGGTFSKSSVAQINLYEKPQVYNNYLAEDDGSGNYNTTNKQCNIRIKSSQSPTYSGKASVITLCAKKLEEGSKIGITYREKDVSRKSPVLEPGSKIYYDHGWVVNMKILSWPYSSLVPNKNNINYFYNDRKVNGESEMEMGFDYFYDLDGKHVVYYYALDGIRDDIENISTMCPMTLNLSTEKLTNQKGEEISGLQSNESEITVNSIDFSKDYADKTHVHKINVIGSTDKAVTITEPCNVSIQGVTSGKLTLNTKGTVSFERGNDQLENSFTAKNGPALNIGANVTTVNVADNTTVSATTKSKDSSPISGADDKAKILDLMMHEAASDARTLKVGEREVTLPAEMGRLALMDSLSGTWLSGDTKITSDDGKPYVRGLAQSESDEYISDDYSQKNLYGDTFPLGLGTNTNLGLYKEVRIQSKVKQLDVSVPTAVIFTIYAKSTGDSGFVAPEYKLQNDSYTYEDKVEVDGKEIIFGKREATVDVSSKGIIATGTTNEYELRDYAKMDQSTLGESEDKPIVCLNMTVKNGTDEVSFPLDEIEQSTSTATVDAVPGKNILQLTRPHAVIEDSTKRYYQIPKLIEEQKSRTLEGHHTLSLGFKID